MRTRLGWRARLTAVVGICALVGTGLTLAASTAHATDSQIFLGPAAQCPGAGWDCRTTPQTVTQTQNNNVLRCVLDDCSGPFIQTSTTGNNTIDCLQSVAPAETSSGTQSTNQACKGSQTNSGGNNTFTITQTATLAAMNLALGNKTQDAKQAAEVTQSTTGSGTNYLKDTQTTCATVSANVQIPATQGQEVRQKLTVHKQTSDAGRQDLIVNQQQACGSQPMTSNVQAPQAIQTQNTNADQTYSKANQWINIGPGDKNCDPNVTPGSCEMGMVSNTGINHAEFTQNENFSQKASGPGGVDAGLTKATQTQGSSLAPVLLFWRIDATNGCSEMNVNQGAGVFGLNGTTDPARQTKTWTQDASPSALGTKAQKQDDDLGSIIGGLTNSPCKANVAQNFTLSQTGTGANTATPPAQICGEYQDIHAKIGLGSSGRQSCQNNNNPPSTNQAVDQSQWQITNGCSDTSCQKSGISVTGINITADQATEGQSFTLPVATFTDTDTAHAPNDTATIDWGDNTPSSGPISPSCNNGTCTVSGTHTYAEETSTTPYTVKTTVTNAGNSTTSAATSTASVADSALAGQGKTLFAANNSVLEGSVVASFTDGDTTEYNRNTSDYSATYSATIDWGDGGVTPDAGTISADATPGVFDVSGHHSYATSGPFTITVTIKDAGGAQTIVKSTYTGYQYLAHGSFAIGQPKSANGTSVTWWGSSWSSANGVSSPPSFKGYENTIDNPKCGQTWKTTTGNSPPPPATGIPRFMAVIVTSSVTGGNVPTGNITRMVVVDTLGTTYQPDPSHPGTGTVVGTISICP
jgi:hypothetical protein